MAREISVQRMLRDFEYYAEQLLVIKPKAGNLCRFALNPVQRMLFHGVDPKLRATDRRYQFVLLDKGIKEYWAAQEPVRLYILKARQMGMSTFCTSYMFNRAHTRPGTNCMVVAQDDSATTGIFQMARMFYAYLPEPLRPQIKNSNVRELAFQSPTGEGGLNSWIKTQTAGNKNIGRSKTIQHLHCSELSYWLNAEVVVDGLFEAVPDMPETSIIVETTAEGLGSFAYHAWLSAKEMREQHEPGGLNPTFLPWFVNPEYQKAFPPDYQFRPEDKDFKDQYGLNWEQVYWYKSKLAFFEQRKPGRGLSSMKKEYPCTDFESWQAAGQSAFPDQTIELIFKYQVKAPRLRYTVQGEKLIADPKGLLRVWEGPEAGVSYAIGVDPAHGVGRDYAVISVIRHPGYRQVAEWASNTTSGTQLIQIIRTIALYYNEAVVAVEVNGSGLLLNANLFEIYSNLYRWEVFDKQQKAETQKLGWQTTRGTKELLIDHANALYTPDVKAVIRSEQVAEQMRLLRTVPLLSSGIADYDFMSHTGDHLMAWMIAVMCCWRKIARYDLGAEIEQPVTEVTPDLAYRYDQRAVDIAAGTLLHQDFLGGELSGDQWLCH